MSLCEPLPGRPANGLVRQILCRDERLAPSMGTETLRVQERSGKRNLTHHMLRCRNPW